MDDTNSAPTNSAPIKKGRGPTRLSALTASRLGNQKVHIDFDQDRNAIGPESGRFNSYVGLQGRSKVCILIEDWDHVPEETKDHIWECILLTYDAPDDEILKKRCISSANLAWRAFKTMLTNKYIYGEYSHISPCDKYKFIAPDVWDKFIKIRHTAEFLEKSKKGKENAAKNKYPHVMSRGGYKLANELIMEEKMKRNRLEAQTNPSINPDAPPSPPLRGEKWKKARLRKTGQYVNQETEVVARNIDTLSQSNSTGTSELDGPNDVLTAAIGRPEHSGRVRTAGKFVGHRDYWGKPSSRRSSSIMDAAEFKAQVEVEVKARVEAEVNEAKA